MVVEAPILCLLLKRAIDPAKLTPDLVQMSWSAGCTGFHGDDNDYGVPWSQLSSPPN